MPIVSGGGGGAGAVAPLTLTGTSDTVQLDVKGVLNQNANILTLSNGNTGVVFAADAFGDLTLGGQVYIAGAAAGNLVRLFVDGTGNTTRDVAQFLDSSGALRAGVNVDGALYTLVNAAPADGHLSANQLVLWFDPTNGAAKLMVKAKQADGTVVAPGLTGRDLATAPAVSAASTLALGTAYQNTLGYDVLLCVYLSVTVNTSGVLKLGVGPTTTPTQQTLVTGITSTGLWPVPIYLPNQYYALLSVTGTITVAVDGQIAMPV